MYRAYIAQHKYRVVLDGISESPSTPTGLKAIRKVADYFNSIGLSHINCIYFEMKHRTNSASKQY